uniref:Uncharacterized protein n=1 Tax=Lactuca sativa TaxID=4236 RepID=A0A9R1V170_LACSA|nr:hypothetical protein LSAT_V11C700363450 [Lactuca sativa]
MNLFLFHVQSASLCFWVMLVLSLVMAIILNYTKFLCTIVNYALTTTTVGDLKGLRSTVLLTGRSSSTLSECEYIGDQHSRWFVVFACLRANGNCITYTL